MDPSKRKSLLKKLNLSELNAACSNDNEEAVQQLLGPGNKSPTAKAPTLKRTLSREASSTPDKEETFLPIHTACQSCKSSAKIIEVLLTSCIFSVEDQTVNRDSALHVACISRNLEAVQALLRFSERRTIEGCLNHQNKDGNTPFHLAASCCCSDITASLLQQLTTSDNAHSIITKRNKLGQTCLGIATEKQDWPTAQLLLAHSHNNPASLYSDFLSLVPDCSLMADFKLQALDCEPIDVFVLGDQDSGKSTLISTLLQATQPAGLTKYATMLAATFTSSRTTSETCKISIVPSTVECRRHRGSHDHKCPVTFHDVNNYHGYSQEAIFKCTRDPLEALYMISVDMTKDNVESSILYWLHFLYRQLAEYSITLSPRDKTLKILVVGSFYDCVSSSHSRLLNITDLLSQGKITKEFASHFTWCGSHCVNTKKTSLCSAMLTTVHDQCCHLHSGCLGSETKSLLAQSYILATFLLKEYPNNAVVRFNDIIGRIHSTESTLCALLPKKNPTRMEMLCQNLKFFSRFKVLMLTTASRKVGYIIFNYKYLLKSIEQAFIELSHRSQHGIVARQDIKEVFEYHHQFIIGFLEHLNLCEKVSSHGLDIMRRSIRTSGRSRRSRNTSQRSTQEFSVTSLMPPTVQHKRSKSESDSVKDFTKTTDEKSKTDMKSALGATEAELRKRTCGRSLTASPGTTSKQSHQTSSRRASRHPGSRRKEVPHYFLPTLISRMQSKELWDDDNDEYGYGFAWCLVPHEGDTWFLSPKFITVMLFRLLFSFAPSPTTTPKFPLERTCELWDQGIVWCDPQGARICVAISNYNKIALSMQCLKGSEIACLSIRNEIMSDIKQKLEEIHPGITPREVFLPLEGNKGKFPVFDPSMSYSGYDREEIRKAIAEDRTVLCTKAKKHKNVDSLLYFEPLCFLSQQLLQELFDPKNRDTQINDDFCMTFAKKLSCKWTFLAKHWETILQKYYIDSLVKDSTNTKECPHDTAMEMLAHLREIDYKEPSDRVDTYSGLQKSLFEISIFQDSITGLFSLS